MEKVKWRCVGSKFKEEGSDLRWEGQDYLYGQVKKMRGTINTLGRIGKYKNLNFTLLIDWLA